MSSKTYLVTGGAGFIGSHLSEYLLSQGHRVSIIDNLSTGRLSNIAHLLDHPDLSFARADITDKIVLDRLTSEADIIIHLAAAVGVQLIVEHPVHTIRTNILGTEAVLDAALRYNCRILVASTSEVYGKGAKFPFSEEDDLLLGATNKSRWAYAASKMVDEFMCFAFEREYGLQAVPVRFFNTVGPRQSGQYGMVIPRLVQQALRGETITVFGDGLQSRCFCHVADVVRAVVGLANNTEARGVYNIGNTEEISIDDLATRIKALTGSASPIIKIPYDQAYAPGFEDMMRRQPDITRINTLLGWQPTYTLDDILQSVIEYEKHAQ